LSGPGALAPPIGPSAKIQLTPKPLRIQVVKPSAEARERAERLLAKLRGPASESERTAQTRRGLEVLEWIGNESARELVEILAKGADGAALTEEAKAMLARWRR
jgi:hypothetical protein